MLLTKLFNCLKGIITNTPRYIHTLETHSRLGLEMVRIRNGKPLAHKLFVSKGWYLFAEVCSRNLSLNAEFAVWQYMYTNPGYLNVKNMLPKPSVVEIINSNSHKNRKWKCDWWSDTNAAKRKKRFPKYLEKYRNFGLSS